MVYFLPQARRRSPILLRSPMEKMLSGAMVDDTFFEPALRVLRDYCRERRDTPQLSDEVFLRGGHRCPEAANGVRVWGLG